MDALITGYFQTNLDSAQYMADQLANYALNFSLPYEVRGEVLRSSPCDSFHLVNSYYFSPPEAVVYETTDDQELNTNLKNSADILAKAFFNSANNSIPVCPLGQEGEVSMIALVVADKHDPQGNPKFEISDLSRREAIARRQANGDDGVSSSSGLGAFGTLKPPRRHSLYLGMK